VPQPTPKIADALKQAVASFQAQRFDRAEALCRAIVHAEARHFDALYLLAVVQTHVGRLPEALASYDRALAIQPRHAEALKHRGIALQRLKRFADALSSYDQVLAIRPDDADALINRGIVLRNLRRFDEALASYDRALAIKPDYAEALNSRGIVLRELQRFEQALASYDRALATKPDYTEALNNRGNALRELERYEEALASYDQALAIKPNYADALNNRGNVLQDLKRFEDAWASYDQALAIRPDYADALNNRGTALRHLKRYEEALASYDQALAIKPNYADALNNRGNVLQDLKRFEDAWASYDQALAIRPDYADALNNRGTALRHLKRYEEALASYDKALAVNPQFAEALLNRGITLHALGRLEGALASYDQALAINPNDAEALYNRGITLRELKRFEEALASYDRALAINPNHAEVLNSRGNALSELGRFEEALTSYNKARAIAPDHRYALGELAHCALQICDWARAQELEAELRDHIQQGKSIVSPFTLLGYHIEPSLHLECARNLIRDRISVLPEPLWSGTSYRHERVRVAYLSADFRQHPSTYLMAELFELHDRTRFEVLGVSFGPDDRSDVRARLVKSFDQFHEVRLSTDHEVAKLLTQLQIDIAVDSMGHTRDARLGIFAYRPAPIQISYLGYPGTMGAPFIDYVIADEIVLPFDQQRFFTEKIIQLPGSYQVNDSRRKIAERTPTRREAGLPDDGFVFCCFNNSWKIAAPVFDVWMRLLKAVEGSILWLLADKPGARLNLRKQAAARGIDPARLVFAGRLPLEDHLARHRLADLFLDTLPYNAHTTASDALWAGLALVTCRGESFAGRVAASLLNAIGLPELVTTSLDEYEALALRLARDGSLLQSIRAKLAQNRLCYPLFDTQRFRRHLEAAYVTAWEIWQRGERPRSFRVEAQS
jgi:predicted O-linked N-acetylglucosamine transferase (SPINDLY family)